MSDKPTKQLNKDIYKMNLHDSTTFEDKGIHITRVPAGWIYEFIAYDGLKGGIVFVPYDNHFQENGLIMNNQATRLLNHFNEGKTIDRLRALTELSIFELSSRVGDIEDAGYKINRERKTILNRYGEKCSVVEYSLVNPFTELP